MTRVHHIMLEQLRFCFPVILSLVLFYTDTVRGEIVVNCGPGAVIGQPYNLHCTNLPATLTNGINVFLEGDTSNSIIYCFASKDCSSRNGLLYSVVSPHNDSLYFTILNVTTDHIDKKVYCVDDTTLDLSSPKPSCTIEIFTPTTDKDGGLTGGEIAGIVIGVFAGVAIIVVIVVIYKKKQTK